MEKFTLKPNSAYTMVGYLRPAFEYLRTQNQSLAPYLGLLGIEETDLLNPDLPVNPKDVDQLFLLAEKNLNDPNVGLHMGRAMQVHHLGVIGMLAMNCSYAHEFFELHSRYESLMGEGLRSEYVRTNEAIVLRTQILPDPSSYSRHSCEYSLSGWMNLKEQFIGMVHSPIRVELPYNKPADDSAQRKLFHQVPLSYQHDTLQVFFPAALNEYKLLASDSSLKTVLEVEARKQLQTLQGKLVHSDPFLSSVRQEIAQNFNLGKPGIQHIANAMGTSTRSLQRQLDAADTNFNRVLDNVRYELAERYIRNEDLSLVDIALMLGFSEQSSFQRAFKNWFGQTPGSYRRQKAALP